MNRPCATRPSASWIWSAGAGVPGPGRCCPGWGGGALACVRSWFPARLCPESLRAQPRAAAVFGSLRGFAGIFDRASGANRMGRQNVSRLERSTVTKGNPRRGPGAAEPPASGAEGTRPERDSVAVWSGATGMKKNPLPWARGKKSNRVAC